MHGLLPIHTHDNPANTLLATSIVEASKRSFSTPPQKKEPLTIDIVRRVCEKFARPSYTLNDPRAALIFSLGFSGLFRVGELLQLTAANIDIASSHLEITVKRSKTDQYGLGNKIFIAKTNGHACPHGLLSRYFALAGILPHSDEYIFREIHSFKAKSARPVISKPISYSRCREIIKDTSAAVGEDPQLYGTHSMRSGGNYSYDTNKNRQPGRK